MNDPLVQLKILNVDKTASKWLLRSEETAKNKNKPKTQSHESFLFLFLSKNAIEDVFRFFSYIFLGTDH